MKTKLLLIAGMAVLMAACGDSTPKTETVVEEEPVFEEGCAYQLNLKESEIKWTAFKFTEKVGVSGKFDSFYIVTTTDNIGIAQFMKDARFEAKIGSINTGDPSRDEKIIKHFFGSMENTPTLFGGVLEANGDNQSGTVKVFIRMNNMELPIDMTYSREGDMLVIKGEMDVDRWNAQASIKKLNDECKDLHTGADGISFLSNIVELELRAPLIKTCETKAPAQ